METTVHRLRILGIPVGLHWSALVAFAVVAWTLAGSVFPSAYPEVGGAGRLAMALTTTGLLFLSVVVHELAHAAVARREGMAVRRVSLWLLGGESDVGGRPRSPGQELRVAAAGPALSLALAGVLVVAAAWAEGRGAPVAVTGVLAWVARLNLAVATFNLVPVLPLDGGRILRSCLWRRRGDALAATRAGARAGQALGLTMVVVGVLDVAAGARVLGLWLVVLGAFLLRAASNELTDARTRHRLTGLTVAAVMASDPGVVLDDTPVARLVEHPPAPVRSGYPVLRGGRLLGVVALADARRVPAGKRGDLRVEDVMTPLDDVHMVDADAAVVDVVDRLDRSSRTGQVVVVDDGRVVGLLDEDDVAGALDRSPSGLGGAGASGGLRAWIVVATACLVAGAALYRPPYVVVSPVPPIDVTDAVSVTGVPVTPLTGRYLVPRVEFHRTNGLATLFAAVRDHRRVLPAARADRDDAADSPGVSRETRTLAAVAAALSQGLAASVTGTGVRVVAVRAESPAAGVLRPGDVVVAVDGQQVTQAGQLAELLRAGPPGTTVGLSVERAGRVEQMAVTTAAGGVGITVETRDLAVELPFEVRFEARAGGGAGAGLAYALAIADLLSPADVAQGRSIAASGTVDADGHVGAVADPALAGAVGAAVLVGPVDQVGGARPDGLQVEGVASLAGALEALSTTV